MSRAILSSEAIPDTVAPRRSKPRQVETPKEKKARISQHDRFAGSRARCLRHLEKSYHHLWLQIRKCRAVIDEPFAHARNTEVLVSFRRGKPSIVNVEQLEDFLSNHTRLKTMRSEELFTEILRQVSMPYLKERAKVRHWVWKDPSPPSVAKVEKKS